MRRGLVLAIGLALSALPLPAAAAVSDPAAAPTTTAATAPAATTTTAVATTTTSTTTTTAVPTSSAPGGAVTPVQPARPTKPVTNPTTPSRGTTRQVTPTLPPPTTTTTIPPEEVLPANSGTGRRVVYSNSLMRVWAVDDAGRVVKTHRVSGKRFIPSPGTYSVFSKSLYTYSRNNPSIKWMYMVRFAHSPSGDNIGFHEIPTQCNSSGQCWKLQTEAQLGQALSGGCVRQSTPDAIWMWNWAGIGTKVVVLP